MVVTANEAKAGNFSDVSGTIITTGDLVGGAFAPGSSKKAAFKSSQIQAAVNQTAQAVNLELASQNLPVTTPGVSATNISPAAQNALAQLINQPNANSLNRNPGNLNNAGGASSPLNPNLNTENLNALASQIETNLMNGGAASNSIAVRNLVSSLRGLTNGNQVNAAKLRSAVVAYNDLTKSASDDYIINPPQELLAIDSVLSYLVKASLTGQEIPVQNNVSPPTQPVTPPEEKPQPPLVPVTPVQPVQSSPPSQPSQRQKPKPIIPQTW